MAYKTNKFLLELFNVPETTVASDLTLANSDILSWTLDSVELIKSEYVAKISVTMKEFVEKDFLDGHVGLSAANHEVLGTDLYIHELEGAPISLHDKGTTIMNTKLPNEFKFKADDKPINTIKFILFLISQGFETVCPKDEFISTYVLTDDFDAYGIENKKIVVHNSGRDFDNDPVQEVVISDFDLDIELTASESNAIYNQEIVDMTIKSLSKLDPSKLSPNDVSDIDTFRLQLNGMK